MDIDTIEGIIKRLETIKERIKNLAGNIQRKYISPSASNYLNDIMLATSTSIFFNRRTPDLIENNITRIQTLLDRMSILRFTNFKKESIELENLLASFINNLENLYYYSYI